MFNLICLLDLDANAHTVYAGLNQDSLVLIPRNRQGIQQNFRGSLRFDLRDVVPLGCLGCEV